MYRFHSKLILRTPLKSYKNSFNENELIELFSGDIEQEAMYVASPNLWNQFQKLIEGNLQDKEHIKMITTLLKYALRMHTRATPFGLFATNSVVEFSKEDNYPKINIDLKASLTKKTNLDGTILSKLSKFIQKLPEVKNRMKVFSNDSLYNHGDNLRYFEHIKEWDYRLQSVNTDMILDGIIDLCENGCSIQNVIDYVMTDANYEREEVEKYIDTLIDNEILKSELENTTTDRNYLLFIMNKLIQYNDEKQNDELEEIIVFVKTINDDLEKLDKKISNDICSYEDIINLISSKLSVESKLYFMVNSYRELSKNKINCNIEEDLRPAINILNKLRVNNENNLSQFKNKFKEKYGEKKIKLIKALDQEHGIGYGQNSLTAKEGYSQLIDGIVFPSEKNGKQKMELNHIDIILLKLLDKHKQATTIDLMNESLIDKLDEDWLNSPATTNIRFSIIGNSSITEKYFLDFIGGATSTRMIGRFGQDNEEILEIMKETSSFEQSFYSDYINAEIIHLPESKASNILNRPSFREYEIQFIGNSRKHKSKKIKINDLFLYLNGDELVLASERLNKKIKPYLSNAHEYSTLSLPIYQFLSDISWQDENVGLYFNWGGIKSLFSFLPRITVGKVIISKSLWNIDIHWLLNTFLKGNYQDDLIEIFKKIRKELNIPKVVSISEKDTYLIINLENELSLKLFLSFIKNKKSAQLEEVLYDEHFQEGIVNDSNQSYVNEFVGFLYNENKRNLITSPEKFNVIPINQNQVNFPLGSEWLYYKIYSGVSTLNEILFNVKAIVDILKKEDLIHQWFFIRYADPSPHLRIRFNIKDSFCLNRVINEFNNVIYPLLQKGLIDKIQNDTYEREIDRYGGLECVKLSENLFDIDSECIVSLLNTVSFEKDNNNWVYSLKIINDFLNLFNISIEDKLDLMYYLKTSFGNEFNIDKLMTKQINERYRNEKQIIFDCLKNNRISSEIEKCFKMKEIRFKRINSELINLVKDISSNRMISFLSGHVHMSINRFFISKQRMHELVVYEFLWKFYKSEIAIKKREQCEN